MTSVEEVVTALDKNKREMEDLYRRTLQLSLRSQELSRKMDDLAQRKEGPRAAQSLNHAGSCVDRAYTELVVAERVLRAASDLLEKYVAEKFGV